MAMDDHSALSTQHSALRVGVQLHPQHTSYREFRDATVRMEGIGVDSIWNWDHFFALYRDPDGAHFEGWTLLAAMAEATTRATVGCMVTCNSYRNPALLSNMAKTVDHIADGRFILGIGAGWFERDYREYGYEFGTAGDRLRHLEEGLNIIKARWAKDNPKPVRGTIPILIGGGGEKVTLRLVAQYGDLWNSFGPPETWRDKNRVLDEWCRRVGRDPAAIERTVMIDEDELAGADRFAEAGATHLILGIGHPFDGKAVERLVTWRDRQVDRRQ
jgi:probable F420-dependent oxidoreductase